MKRLSIEPRGDWRETAAEHGFDFHTIDGEAYWDESACYRFSLRQIEDDLEDPSAEIEQMCFDVVERAVRDEEVLARLSIPETFWELVRASWLDRERNLYGRLDFSYDGRSPARLLEYNADTPTSVYETGVFQWVWLEQAMERGLIPAGSDQFNSLHEALTDAFGRLGIKGVLHLASVKGSDEDAGTVEYIADCARQAGLQARPIFMEDIGVDGDGHFTDPHDETIRTLFKLYPWEWIMADEFGVKVAMSGTRFIEPPWKAVLSNKGLLPLLWEMFPDHPNLLPAWFEGDDGASALGGDYVRKPLLSREGANVEIFEGGRRVVSVDGDYGDEGYVLQALHPLPDHDGHRPVMGVWMVASTPCALGIREERAAVTGNDARFVPHIIVD